MRAQSDFHVTHWKSAERHPEHNKKKKGAFPRPCLPSERLASGPAAQTCCRLQDCKPTLHTEGQWVHEQWVISLWQNMRTKNVTNWTHCTKIPLNTQCGWWLYEGVNIPEEQQVCLLNEFNCCLLTITLSFGVWQTTQTVPTHTGSQRGASCNVEGNQNQKKCVLRCVRVHACGRVCVCLCTRE